jgi:hypothetical protein
MKEPYGGVRKPRLSFFGVFILPFLKGDYKRISTIGGTFLSRWANMPCLLQDLNHFL